MRHLLSVLMGAAYIVPAAAQYPGMDSKVPWGTVDGTITWMGEVVENRQKIKRVGSCDWQLQFNTDGREVANYLHYKNTDTTAYLMHSPFQFGDMYIVTVTDQTLKGPPPIGVNGQLTMQRNGPTVNAYWVQPAYEAIVYDQKFTYDGSRWQPQPQRQNEGAKKVYCGPKGLVNATVQGIHVKGSTGGPAKPFQDINLAQVPPNAYLSMSWDLYLPCVPRQQMSQAQSQFALACNSQPPSPPPPVANNDCGPGMYPAMRTHDGWTWCRHDPGWTRR